MVELELLSIGFICCGAGIALHGISRSCAHNGGVRPVLPYTILLRPMHTRNRTRGAEVGWDDWLASPDGASATQRDWVG